LVRRGADMITLLAMRVLVTGGGGFIGTHIADRLLKDGPWRARGARLLLFSAAITSGYSTRFATGRRSNKAHLDVDHARVAETAPALLDLRGVTGNVGARAKAS
jgi:nucleoside-diphosphate-sugar epimerase